MNKHKKTSLKAIKQRIKKLLAVYPKLFKPKIPNRLKQKITILNKALKLINLKIKKSDLLKISSPNLKKLHPCQ